MSGETANLPFPYLPEMIGREQRASRSAVHLASMRLSIDIVPGIDSKPDEVERSRELCARAAFDPEAVLACAPPLWRNKWVSALSDWSIL
jgi:hypothetical protein